MPETAGETPGNDREPWCPGQAGATLGTTNPGISVSVSKGDADVPRVVPHAGRTVETPGELFALSNFVRMLGNNH